MQVGRVDGTANPGIASPFNINGYPTVVLIRGGALIATYKGARTLEAVTAFVGNALHDPPPAASAGGAPPQAPGTRARAASNGGRLRRLFSREALLKYAQYVTDMDPLRAGQMAALTVLAVVVGLVLLLFATTQASPR